jgi:hypothetical protein
MQPITHEFEWTQNLAHKLKANILKEHHDFQKSESLSSLSQKMQMKIQSKFVGGNDN